jgi:hypothetical protein
MSNAVGFTSSKWAASLDLPKGQKAVLVALAHIRNDKTGACYPGQDTIARATGYTVRSVGRLSKELAALGLIEAQKRFRPDGAPTSMAYVLHLDRQPQRPVVTMTTGHDDQRSPVTGPSDIEGVTTGHHVLCIDEQEDEQEEEQEVHTAIALIEGPSFDDFYNTYPRKMKRPDALKAWQAAVKRADPQLIVGAAAALAASPHLGQKQFIPYPATWLRADGWDDPLPEPPEAERRKPTRTEQNLAFARQLAQQEVARGREIAS